MNKLVYSPCPYLPLAIPPSFFVPYLSVQAFPMSSIPNRETWHHRITSPSLARRRDSLYTLRINPRPQYEGKSVSNRTATQSFRQWP